MAPIYNLKDQRVDYEGLPRAVWREGDVVYKKDDLRLGPDWRKQMERILEVCPPPAWRGFIENGYATKYIDGPDLQGNLPFIMDGNAVPCTLPLEYRYQVLQIFMDMRWVGERLGFTFGDMTCGNMMFDGNQVYLIDFEVIVSYPFSNDYQSIWDNTISLVFGRDNELPRY